MLMRFHMQSQTGLTWHMISNLVAELQVPFDTGAPTPCCHSDTRSQAVKTHKLPLRVTRYLLRTRKLAAEIHRLRLLASGFGSFKQALTLRLQVFSSCSCPSQWCSATRIINVDHQDATFDVDTQTPHQVGVPTCTTTPSELGAQTFSYGPCSQHSSQNNNVQQSYLNWRMERENLDET